MPATNLQATGFEFRHQTMLHLLVVGAAFLTYAIWPDDVVWALIKNHADRTLLERLIFSVGTLLIFGSATLLTLAHIRSRDSLDYGSIYVGRILFVLAMGLFTPAAGAIVLLVGEGILILRLFVRERFMREHAILPATRTLHLSANRISANRTSRWPSAFRQESSKWGLVFTMLVFTLTLKDKLAEVLGCASFFLWTVLNFPDFLRSRQSGEGA